MDIDLKGSPFDGLTQEEFGVLARLMDQNQQNSFQKAKAVGTGLLDMLIRDKGVKISVGKRASVKVGLEGAEATFKPSKRTNLKIKKNSAEATFKPNKKTTLGANVNPFYTGLMYRREL
tara:strand:+ start:430 stop:786 length:357 start_codon:yes stop_codon:yes gene_type:complete